VRSQRINNLGFQLGLGVLASLLILAAPSQVLAGPFTRLQVLVPGETEAPGTPTGKTGAPAVQTVGAPFAVIVRACDEDWNTVTDVSDAVEWDSTDESANLPPTVSLSAGTASVSVTFHAAGTFTISGQDLSDPTIAEAFSANVMSVVLAGFEFKDIKQKHNTAGVPFTIEITAIDPVGNPVRGYSGPVNLQELTSYGLGRISPATVTLDGGVWSGNVMVYRADETNTSRGNVNVYAFLPSDTSINGASNPFLVHPGSLKRAQIVLPGQTPLPGSATGVTGTPASQGATQPFTVDLYSTDDYWNLCSSNDVLRVVSSDPGASTPVTIALVGGFGQTSLHLGTVGAQTLTVNDLSNGTVRAMTSAPIMVIPSFAHHFEFDDLPPTVVAGSEYLVKIRAVDGGGNTIPDFNGDGILTANTGPGSISPAAVTFTDGVWLGIMTFFGAGGAVQVTCADYATPPHQGTSNPTQVLPGPYVATQIILPGQAALGGTATGLVGLPDGQDAGQEFTVQVRAVDQYFNRVTGINNSVIFSGADPNMVVAPTAALVNGEAFIPVTIYMAGSQTMQVTDAVSQGIASPSSSTFHVAPGSYAKLLLLAPGETARPGDEDGREGEATDQSITYLFTFTVLSTDQWYNQVIGIGDVVHLTSTDPLAELPEDVALENGKAFLGVRLATGGYQQFTLTSVSTPAIAASVSQVRAISSGLSLEAYISAYENVDPVTTQAGSPFFLKVRVVNIAGAVIQEASPDVVVTAHSAANLDVGGRGNLLPVAFTLEQGQGSVPVTYDFAESIILRVADVAGSMSGLTGQVDVQPGPPAIMTLSSSPGWVPANRTAVISARISDEFSNPIANQEVAFATAASDSGQLGDHGDKADNKSVVSVTGADGIATVDYLSPRFAQVAQVTASSGQLSATYELETALVDPNTTGGYITSYPNPFHPDETPATIAYVLDDMASVRVRVYTLSGGLVLDQQYAAGGVGGNTGLNEIQWDGRNGNGDPVASGGYIVYVEAEGNGATQHVMRRKIGVLW